MTNKYKIIVNTGKDDAKQSLDVVQGQGANGQPLRIKAQAGAKYQIEEVGKANSAAPEYVRVKRVGKNLHLVFEDGSAADVIFEDYYDVIPSDYNAIVGATEDGSFYQYIPEDPKAGGLIPSLNEGTNFVSLALGGAEVVGAGFPIVALGLSPLLLASGLVAAGVLVAAQAANTPPAQPTMAVNDADGDGKINAAGTAVPGSVVTVTWPDGSTSTAPVDSNGNWSVESPTVQASGPVKAVVTDSNGNTSPEAVVPYVDTTPPVATVNVDTLTPDNLISAQEAGQETLPVTGTVSGEFTPGDVVSVSVNDKTFTGTVDAQGDFSIDVPTADLLADPDTKLQVSVLPTDAADNPGQPATDVLDYATAVLPPVNGALVLDPVAGDNIISLTEGAQPQSTLSGRVTGPFTPGDVVTVNLNGQAITSTLNAQGAFSIAVSMAALKADPDHTVHVTVLAKDPVTGQTQALSNSQSYGVDVTGNPDTALTLDPITGDNLINASEAASLNTPVTGQVTGEFAAGDVVSVVVNNHTFTGGVNAQGEFSINVPTAQLLVDPDTQMEVSILATTPTGPVTATAEQDYTLDTSPPVATVDVDNLTPDNLISAQEAGLETLPVTGTVSGEFTPGDVVSVSVNDKTFTGTVDAQGDFSIDVPTADLLADPDTKLQVSVLPTDAADNPGQPATDVLDYATAVLPPVNGALVLDPVAGDNIISLAEGAQPQSTLSGSVTGPFTPGDVVTVNLNGHAITGTLNAQGAFSIPVSMAALKADPDHTVHVTVLAKYPVTGQTQALSNSQSYGVDVTGNPDTALTLDPITGDNLINASEAASLNTPVTGQVTGEFAAGDVVSVVVNTTTFTGGVNAQGEFSINVPTAQLLVDPDSTVEASVRATTATGPFTATAEQDYSVDTTPPAAPTITSANDPDADGKINASGTAEPGSVVTVTWPDSSTSTAPVDNNGNWSVESPTVQEEGWVSAVVKDVNGNPSSNASAQYVDNKPPAIAITAPVTQNPNGTLTITGTSEPGATVVVNDFNGFPIGTTTVNPNGTWTVTSTNRVPQGQLEAIATDINGQQATAPAQYFDTIPPVATLDVDNLTPDNLISAQEAGLETLPVTGTVSGEFMPGDVVSVSVNDKTFTGTVDAQGDFSIDVPTADLLADPDTKLQVSVLPTDAADNPGQPASDVLDYATAVLPPVNGALVLDPVAGDNIISLTEGALLQSTLSGSVTGPFTPGDVVTVNLNGQAITGTLNAQGAFSIPVSMAALKADPDHTVHVTVLAKDPVTGQTQALSNSQNYGVDVTGNPDTALTLDPITGDNLINASEAASLNTPVTGQVTGEFAAGDVVSVVVNNHTFTGGVNAQGEFSINVPTAQLLVDPDTQLQANVESLVTGQVTATAELDYTVDTTPPAAPTITSANDPDADGKINASGTAEPETTVTVTWPDGTSSTAPVDGSGNWSVESPTVQEEGPVKAVATDDSGNVSDPATAQYVDNTPPAIAITSVTDPDGDGKINAVGTAEPESTVTVIWPDGSSSTAPVDGNGNWSIESPTAQTSGPVKVTATDLNDNPSPQVQAPYVDTIPPVATLDVDNLTPDNLISAQEAGQETLPVTGTVSGEFTPGDVVSVSVNDKTFTGTVDAQGDFSVPVPTADLLADPDTKLQVNVLPTDAADNPGQPATDVLDYATAVLPPVNGALVLDPVADDNIISLAEGAQPQSTLSGSVTGPFTPGDVVTVNLNGQAITGTLNAQGAFSIPVSMAALKADPDC